MNSASKTWLHGAAALIVCLAYLPFFAGLTDVSARHPYAGHVIFVPILAGALLWMERHRLRGLTGGGVCGAAVTILALALGAIAYGTANVPLQALSFVAAVGGLGFWVHGMAGVRRMGFVLAFLLLMMPPPRDTVAALAPAAQHFAAVFTRVVLDCLRIPVEQHGILLLLPGLVLEVAEECSGLRFLPILFVFVSAFARAVLPTISSQLALMALSIPVALLANATRVAATSVGAYAIGPEVLTGPLHYYIGKGFWALALLAMVAIGWLLRSRTAGVVTDGRPRPGPCIAGAP